YADYAERQRIGLLPLDVARARILTSDGAVLAEDKLAFDIAVVIGKLDPSDERRIRSPLRRLFYVPRREELHRIQDAGWKIRTGQDESGRPRTIVEAWSKLEIEYKHEDGKPALDLDPRRQEFALPEHVVNAAGELARLTGERRDELLDKVIKAAMDAARLRTPVFSPVPIIEGVEYETVAAVETRAGDFRGFQVRTRLERATPNGSLAPHVVGYLAKFGPLDVAAAVEKHQGWPGRGYFMNLRIGRAGIEKTMDGVLRGEFGMECIERDHLNRRQSVLVDAPPKAGRDVVLTIDSRLQKITEEAMDGVVGAALFIDVRTGHILAIASSPKYDPARFRQDYAALAANPDQPLWDRAVRGRLPLGSVFKIATALAALEKGCVPASVDCQGAIEYGRRTFYCHRRYGHGPEDLTDAIKHSCNVFFYRTAQQAGDEALIDMARRLGLGRATGVRIAQEYGGKVPSQAPGGELLNLAIGQGGLVVTPLQVAQMLAAVANGRVLMPAKIIRELRPFDAEDPAAEALPDERRPRELGISKRSIDAVRLGLYKVVNEYGGTGFSAFRDFDRPFKVCGKTSTAERTARRDGRVVSDNVGWFAGYAPHDKPRVAFAVAVERLSGPQGGGSAAAPIARRILEAIPLELLGLGQPKEETQ
ncbi:MAG: penicillin-binding transpeptidase domain-containing protein, partial [Planctomycetota bacterium]